MLALFSTSPELYGAGNFQNAYEHLVTWPLDTQVMGYVSLPTAVKGWLIHRDVWLSPGQYGRVTER